MKNIKSVITFSVVLSLLFFSVNAEAASSGYQLKTSASVADFYNDQSIDTYASNFINYNGDYISNYYDALSSLNVDSSLTPFLVTRFFRSGSNITSYRLYVFCYNNNFEINDINIVSTGGLDSLGAVGTCYLFVDFNNSLVNSSDWLIKAYECVFQSDGSFSWNDVANVLQINYMSGNQVKYTFNASFISFIDCDYSCFANNEIISSGVGNVTSSISASDYFNYNRSSLHDLLSIDMPYIDSSGNTIIPAPDVQIEDNSNHMYFQSCDFGFCEPKGISTYNQFGGAYIYCRYVVDDWIVNHISDYSLQISMETLLDNQRYFRTLNYPLDRDGCLTLPFKNFGLTGVDNVTQGFVVVGNNNQTIDTDYFKVNLYSITTEQSKQEWFDNAARTYNTVKAIDIYDTYDFSDVQDFYESNVAKYNKFTINLRAVLVSGEDNSGPVARSFNLVTGSDIATDTTGFDNENPFVPDDSSEDYTPSLPSDTNTTVPSIIVNTGGTWQGTFNGKIGYDPGYTDLKLDVNKDPEGNFTQYLNPMKNQTFGSWFFSFLNDMPGEMKALLIAGTGVGIFFGLYRFIRRG